MVFIPDPLIRMSSMKINVSRGVSRGNQTDPCIWVWPNISKLKFKTNFDRCAIINILKCLTKNFEP